MFGKEELALEAYVPFLYSEDKEVEIFFRESALAMLESEDEWYKTEALYIEADEEETSNKPGLFSKLASVVKGIINTIIQTIKDFIQSIKNAFGPKLTVDAYMDSKTAQLRLSEDIEKITEQIEAEILSERKGVQMISKFVQKISSVTKFPLDAFISDKTIGAAIDKANAFAVEQGGTIIKAAAATMLANKLHQLTAESLHLTEKLQQTEAELEAKRNAIDASKLADYDKNGHTIMNTIRKMSLAIDTTSRRAMKYYAQLTKPVKEFKANLNKYKN